MAVVKFSEELRNNILANASDLFRDKIKAAVEEFNPTWADRTFAKAYFPYMKDINALPKEFFNWIDKVTTSELCGIKFHTSIEIPLSTRVPVPAMDLLKANVADISISKDGYYSASNLRTPDTEMYDDIKTEVLAYKNKITLLTERRDKFVEGVRELIYAHNTLAPALKAWQPLWDLVPEQARARHLLEIKRADKANPQLSADLNALTATIVASKIGV